MDDAKCNSVAVLASGGIDSAVLTAQLSKQYAAVFPIFVRSGLRWEEDELLHLRKYLGAVAGPTFRPLRVFELPVQDIYGDHWGLTGRCVPDADTADEAVYLPGRNLLLISKVAVWCALNSVGTLALGSLGGNPFSDSTPEFDRSFEVLVQRGLGTSVLITRPFASLSKVDVLRRGQMLPLELTFSCINPVSGGHCGRCNKCAERRRGFQHAGIRDMTAYAYG